MKTTVQPVSLRDASDAQAMNINIVCPLYLIVGIRWFQEYAP